MHVKLILGRLSFDVITPSSFNVLNGKQMTALIYSVVASRWPQNERCEQAVNEFLCASIDEVITELPGSRG
jgi:hypothetical protein